MHFNMLAHQNKCTSLNHDKRSLKDNGLTFNFTLWQNARFKILLKCVKKPSHESDLFT